MNRCLLMTGLCAALGMAPPLLAQPAGNPVVWTWNEPLGNAASDSRFRPTVHYDLNWGFTQNYPGTPALLVYRDGTSVGEAVADEVLRRGEKYPVLLLRSIGRGNLATPYLPGTYGDFTPLYDYHVSTSDTDRVNIGSQWVPFIWMTKGIATQTAWTDDFLAKYESEVGYQSAYAPERIAFDQEPPSTMLGYSWTDLLALWTAVQADSRWNTTPVPGYGTQTLSSLWSASGLTAPGAAGTSWLYNGGNLTNHLWFVWLLEIEQTAIASAMDEAFYSRVASRGGIWTGVTCCDYEGTMRSDGAADDYSAPANADCTSTYRGTLSPTGVRYAQNCSGSNIVQAPHLYTDNSFYSWSYFSTSNPFGNSRWASTDDQHTPDYNRPGPRNPSGVPTLDEFWSETSRRQWRFKLDGCSKSFGGSNIPIDTWVTLPNQPLWMLGMGNTTYPGWYDGQSYARNEMVARQSFRATLDSLALSKNHRVNRLLLWNDVGNYQPGPHSQFATNWNYFQRALDLVWGINVTDFVVDPANSMPQGFSQPTRVDKVAYADGSVTTDTTNRVQVNSATNGGIWAITKFQMSSGLSASGNRPESLNFSVDVVMNQSTHMYIFIWDWSIPGWRDIGVSSASGNVPDMDGREYPVIATPNKTMRLMASVAYNDNYRSPTGSGATNTIMLAVFGTPDVGGTQTGYFDMVQCYGGDEGNETRWRPLGDFDGDYAVTSADSTMVTNLFTSYSTSGYAPWLDFNRDGTVNSTDQGLWTSNYLGQTRKIDDFKRSSVDSR